MSEQPNDDGLVPPIKVLRRRLNGVYSAEGLTGPTRRYVLLVVMLVGLASLPTLAAITAGSNELADGRTTVTDVPFIPPASAGPVRTSPPASAGTGSPSPVGPAPIQGQAQKRKTKPRGYGHSAPNGTTTSNKSGIPSGVKNRPWPAGHGVVEKPSRPGKPSRPEPPAGSQGPTWPGAPPGWQPGPTWPEEPYQPDESDHTDPDDSDDGGDADDHDGHGGGGHDGHGGGYGSGQGDPDGSESPARPPMKPARPPWCADRTHCSSRPSHHHRPDRSPHKHCEDVNHRAHWSHHRAGNSRVITVHIEPVGRHGRGATVTEHRRAEQPKHLKKVVIHRWARAVRTDSRKIVSHRRAESARTDSSRRSAVTERPQNLKTDRAPGRTHNGHRHQLVADQADGTQFAARSYRGSHRAERMHRADDNRISRVGRHHADPGHTNRW
ncbi:hypothetical protein [Couchioplanes caeruleus]|uniref:Uncharacterized protein n=2 Tax=Couchioplanes caeruleus TaxID=56438 RepID=A0A1K0FEX3_9ACTN|nr:hypothetical protein [Couchioplanes caeruleus]OJF11381.1 hypothetical protein BG844_26665 [Couchioplanes caeruleus subsp. caeruleus]ROP31025.1 hypothetical protein EDD30_3910 [Couchioplanes caeruleus]